MLSKKIKSLDIEVATADTGVQVLVWNGAGLFETNAILCGCFIRQYEH